MKNSISKRSKHLFVAYIIMLVLSFLPATGIAFNSVRFIIGIPVTIVWLSFCFMGFVILSIVGYKKVFMPWSKEANNLFNQNDINS